MLSIHPFEQSLFFEYRQSLSLWIALQSWQDSSYPNDSPTRASSLRCLNKPPVIEIELNRWIKNTIVILSFYLSPFSSTSSLRRFMYRKIPSNLILSQDPYFRSIDIRSRGKSSRAGDGRIFEIHFRVAISTLAMDNSYSGTGKSSYGSSYGSSSSSSSNGSSGNKVCFIFTIPPAKYRPVFPRDIDISGVLGLLLLTPFLHWLGIYVFFLPFPFQSPSLSSASSSLFYVFSPSLFPISSLPSSFSSSPPPRPLSVRHLFNPFLSLSLSRIPLILVRFPRLCPRVSRTINHARVSPRS